jgi:hypothetical protein
VTAAVYKSGYMLESLEDPTLPVPSTVKMRWVQAISREGQTKEVWNPQRLYAGPSQV